MTVLYLTYNGLTEPLGRRQVLPYVLGLARRGWRFSVVSFEKRETATPAARETVRNLLADAGVTWHPRRYHKRFTLAATSLDVATGISTSLISAGSFDLVHARATVPALMAVVAARLRRVPWIFDVRGLLAQEYVDARHWSATSALFRLTQGCERRLLARADGLVFLTERIRERLTADPGRSGKPVAVIPCAADLDAFRRDGDAKSRIRSRLGIGEAPLLVYSGSLGSWYRLEAMMEFFEVAASDIQGLSFLILTPDVTVAGPAIERHPAAARIRVLRVGPDDVPAYLSAADAGICFLGNDVSKAASSPTKYGEYLAAGLAVVTNPWTGDAARLAGERAWILVDAFDRRAYQSAARELRERLDDPEALRRSAVDLAGRAFSLEKAIDSYEALYHAILRPRS